MNPHPYEIKEKSEGHKSLLYLISVHEVDILDWSHFPDKRYISLWGRLYQCGVCSCVSLNKPHCRICQWEGHSVASIMVKLPLGGAFMGISSVPYLLRNIHKEVTFLVMWFAFGFTLGTQFARDAEVNHLFSLLVPLNHVWSQNSCFDFPKDLCGFKGEGINSKRHRQIETCTCSVICWKRVHVSASSKVFLTGKSYLWRQKVVAILDSLFPPGLIDRNVAEDICLNLSMVVNLGLFRNWLSRRLKLMTPVHLNSHRSSADSITPDKNPAVFRHRFDPSHCLTGFSQELRRRARSFRLFQNKKENSLRGFCFWAEISGVFWFQTSEELVILCQWKWDKIHFFLHRNKRNNRDVSKKKKKYSSLIGVSVLFPSLKLVECFPLKCLYHVESFCSAGVHLMRHVAHFPWVSCRVFFYPCRRMKHVIDQRLQFPASLQDCDTAPTFQWPGVRIAQRSTREGQGRGALRTGWKYAGTLLRTAHTQSQVSCKSVCFLQLGQPKILVVWMLQNG